MSTLAQNHQPDRDQPPPSPTSFEFPARLDYDTTEACMLYSEYSREAKEALAKVQEKAKEWLGPDGSREDGGRLLEMSMTLFLTPAQRQELVELVKGTPLEVLTVKGFTDAVERGLRDETPRVDTRSRRGIGIFDYGVNAGHALRELRADPGLDWEKQRPLVFDVWNGMVQLHNFAASMLQNVQTDITGALIAKAKSSNEFSGEPNVFDVAANGIYREAALLTIEHSKQSAHLKEIADATVPLARALLSLPSPVVKEVALSQMAQNFNLLGRALGVCGEDPQPTLDGLDAWKAFWDTQVPLLSRYFRETAEEQARMKAEGKDPSSNRDEAPQWTCMSRYQGDKEALSPQKWQETVFHELRSEHLWGLALIGVPGSVGDRAFAIVTDVLARANTEALNSRPDYARSLAERDRHYLPDPDLVPPEFRSFAEEQRKEHYERKLEESDKLVHGVSDLFISGLPWSLPGIQAPMKIEPALHLERTLSLLENALRPEPPARGLAFTARMAAQELAIQLEGWEHVAVLDEKPALAERAKQLFQAATVHLPDDWCTGLRKRGILPPAVDTVDTDRNTAV